MLNFFSSFYLSTYLITNIKQRLRWRLTTLNCCFSNKKCIHEMIFFSSDFRSFVQPFGSFTIRTIFGSERSPNRRLISQPTPFPSSRRFPIDVRRIRRSVVERVCRNADVSLDRSVGQSSAPEFVEQRHRTFRLDHVFEHASSSLPLICSQPSDSFAGQHFHRRRRASNPRPFFQPVEGELQILVPLRSTFEHSQTFGRRT